MDYIRWHNAYKEGMVKSFNLGSYLSSLHWLFKDSPARREDFPLMTGSAVFPQSYCGRRWLENMHCMERALQLQNEIVKYVKEVKARMGSEPGCKSFVAIKEYTADPFLEAKLEASLVIARIVHPFLKKYQTDQPMLPLLSTDLFNILKKLLTKIMKPDLMKKTSSAKDLHKLKMTVETNFITAHSADIGTAANDLIKKMKQSELRVLAFKNEFLTFVKRLVTKMLLKSPIKHKLVRSCTFLDPTVMVTEKANTLLVSTLDELPEAKRVTAIDCDAIKDELADFVSTKMDRTLFSHYELTKSGRLDRFLHTHMKKHCPKLWMTVEIILTISHGQASVERGFSFIKEISVDNLSQVSLIAQRRITDYIQRCGGTTKVPVTKDLLTAAARTTINS